MHPDLLQFAEKCSMNQQKIMHRLHSEFTSLPKVVMKERYKLPFYYGISWICYLNPLKGDAIELCFTRGVELEDAHGILHARGRKQIKGVLCTSPKELPMHAIRDTFHEAYLLDMEKPYQHPRKRAEP